MAAYGIFIRDRTLDETVLAEYGPLARGSMAGHKLKPLVAYGALETLEGEPAEGVVVIEFPNMEAAKTWYNSPAYQEARDLRFKGADYRVILVEGL